MCHTLRTIVVLLLVVAPVSTSAQAEPFGIRMGMTVAELQRATGASRSAGAPSGVYQSRSVPSPYPEFNSPYYLFMIAPSTGLCKLWVVTSPTVWVASAPTPDDSHGTALRRWFQRLQKALDQKYGPHKNYDFLRAGSPFTSASDWMTGLYADHRILISFWGTKEGKPLPPPLQSVSLEASAVDGLTGLVTVFYKFSNLDQCTEELKKLDNSSP